jgi:Ala-tRNA(Pro) deacylase
MKVQELLDEQGVAYEVIPHEHVYTAQEVAAAEHVTGHMFAKTVILKAGDEACMLVLPASRHVDLRQAGEVIGADVRMATEEEMKALFPDCETGAEPPFGSQYGLKTWVDESLQGVGEIVFRAGNHDETVKMAYDDYVGLEQPEAAAFTIEDW